MLNLRFPQRGLWRHGILGSLQTFCSSIEDRGGEFLRNVDELLPNYAEIQFRHHFHWYWSPKRQEVLERTALSVDKWLLAIVSTYICSFWAFYVFWSGISSSMKGKNYSPNFKLSLRIKYLITIRTAQKTPRPKLLLLLRVYSLLRKSVYRIDVFSGSTIPIC
jgi:hypothetical protein